MNTRYTQWIIGFTLGLLGCVVGPVAASGENLSNSQYTVTKDVITAGGGRSQSSTYIHTGSLGQSSPLGRSASYLSVNYGGFWGGGMTYPFYTLTVNKSGTGSGTVTGGGINCGPACSEQTILCEEHTSIVLQAQEEPNSTFDGWFVNGSPVTGEITVTSDLTVTAVFEKKPDTDGDGLSDDWEQQIIDADPNDGITTINDVNPNDDFDGDGLTNDEEFWNWTDPTATTEVIADICPMNATGTQEISEVQRLTSFRMDLQLRIRSDNRAAKLVRDVTVLVDGTGRFETSQIQTGSLFQNSLFPGRIYARTDGDGRFSIDVKGVEEGRVAFSIEQLDGGAGVILPSSKAIASVHAPFMTAVWKGRRLVFPGGQDAIQIRIADLAAAMYNFSQSASPTWEIEGISFEHVTISQKGYLLFGQQPPLATTNIDWQTAPDGLLAPFLDDLIMKPESRVYVNWDWMTEPYFVVEWSRMGHVSDPNATLTFQIQIWQRSKQVRFVYRNLFDTTGMPGNWPDAIVGCKYSSGKIFIWNQSLTSFSALEVIDVNAPSVSLWVLDSDQDRLFRYEEEQLGTDPKNWDSDFDRMSDGWENTFSPYINPLQPDANDDADGDGYLNIIEYYLGTKPINRDSPTYSEPDTDKDGMPDSWETTYGLNPNSADDALVDTDFDRYVNVLEYAIGGDPMDVNHHGTHPVEPGGGSSNATYP